MLTPLLLLAAAAPAPAEPAEVVASFVAAYNARDYYAMGAALEPEAKWYSVEGPEVSVEGSGAEALVGWTRNYLGKSCTTCRSELLGITTSGRFVSTVERASWTDGEGACRAQSSPAVYEVVEGRIRAVWYFPNTKAGPCPERAESP